MVGADDRVLEYLSEEGPATPSAMSEDDRMRFSRTHINQRCIKLADYGFLVNLGNGVYQITEQGEKYLAEELDAETVEKSNGEGEGTASV
jgi:hypothetical protein